MVFSNTVEAQKSGEKIKINTSLRKSSTSGRHDVPLLKCSQWDVKFSGNQSQIHPVMARTLPADSAPPPESMGF